MPKNKHKEDDSELIDAIQERDIKTEPTSKLRAAAQQYLDQKKHLPLDPVYPAKVDGRWLVFWLPAVYSQIYINPRLEPAGRIVSNACTIICVLVCHYCEQRTPQPVRTSDGSLNTEYMIMFSNIMGEANNVHHYMHNRGILRMVNLTVPEALAAARYRGRNLKEWFYFQHSGGGMRVSFGDCIGELLHAGVHRWTNNRPRDAKDDNLFAILIVDQRSVLLYYRKSTRQFFFFDSHSHFEFGGCIGYTPRLDYATLYVIGNWYSDLCTKMAHGKEQTNLELTFLYFSTANYDPSFMIRQNQPLPSEVYRSGQVRQQQQIQNESDVKDLP